MEKEYEFAREGIQRRNRQGAFGLGWTGGWCVAGLAMNQPSAGGPSPNGAKSDSVAGRRCAAWSPSLGDIKLFSAVGTYASVDHAARRTYVRSKGFRTTEQGAFRLAGNESTASGFPFSSRSDKRGGVSRKERINRSQRGAAKSRAVFPNGPERKTILSQAKGAPRGLRYWAKSNDYRRREHMPAATVRRAGRTSEAGIPE